MSDSAYLFDTDAISEVLKRRPFPKYVEWLRGIPREDQFTSAVVVAELYEGAFRLPASAHLRAVEERVLPAVTVIPFDTNAAYRFGVMAADLRDRGRPLPDADLQIAATAIYHDLVLVTGNVKHFDRVAGLRIDPILAEARTAG